MWPSTRWGPFERFRVPRMVSAALVIVAGTKLIGTRAYRSNRQIDVSGFLNLIPFLRAVLGALIPIGAGLIQNQPLGTHRGDSCDCAWASYHFGELSCSENHWATSGHQPARRDCGILFWSWLGGLMSVILAVPRTALVKIFADLHPSLGKLSNLLAEHPVGAPPLVPSERCR
jgi:hypothetical protein